MTDTVYDFQVKRGSGEEISLKDFKGKVLVIVNTASRCGFTPQYEGLQKLQDEFGKDLEVIAFPCNQFGAQEPGANDEIQSFCDVNYSVKFPVMSKIDVNGDKAHPLYEFLKKNVPGIMGSEGIKWNFTKFLIDRTGKPKKRFAPQTKPEEMSAEIKNLM